MSVSSFLYSLLFVRVPNPVPSALPMFHVHLCYLLNCTGCITCTVKVVPVLPIVPLVPHQFHQLYRTSFTSAKSAPNRVHQKNNAHFAENDTNFTENDTNFKENNAHFTKNKANISVQYSQRTDSVQYSGSIRLVHLVRCSWYTWCSTNGTLSAASVIQLAQYKH